MRSLVFFAVLCGCGRLGFDPTTSATGPDGGTPVGGRCAIDLDCTAHAACVAEQTCECASGFTSNGGGGCTWSGVVADPELANAPVWTSVGGGTIDGGLSITGMRDPGAGRFSGNALCRLARLTQTVTMPRLAQAGPLVFDMTYRYVDPMGPIMATRASVGLGPVWSDDLPTALGAWVTVRRCLGAGQYASPASTGIGAPVLLQLSPASTTIDCAMPGVTLDIDHVDIVPANPGECPDVGLAANGDAEGTDGWTLSAGTTSVAAIEPGIGSNGSRGVRLYLAQRCDAPSASVSVSIPFDGSPAFELYDRTTAGFSPTLALGGRRFAIAPGTGAGRTTRACVPTPLRGGVSQLTAYLDGGNGTCGDPLGYEMILDDVVVVDDARCGTDAAIADPGFESRLGLLDAFSFAGKGVAQIQTAIVHSGSAALRLDASVTCYGGTWAANVVAPSSQPTAGPALTFFYRADAANQTRFAVSTMGASFTGTADATWRQGLVCLDPTLGGRSQRVSFGRSFLGGTCEQAMATETAYIDDLALTTDPSCPP